MVFDLWTWILIFTLMNVFNLMNKYCHTLSSVQFPVAWRCRNDFWKLVNVVSLVVDGKWAWELATLSCERVGYIANVDNVVLYRVINSNYIMRIIVDDRVGLRGMGMDWHGLTFWVWKYHVGYGYRVMLSVGIDLALEVVGIGPAKKRRKCDVKLWSHLVNQKPSHSITS